MENIKAAAYSADVAAKRPARIALVLQLNLANIAWAQAEAVARVNNPQAEVVAA